MNEQRAFWKGFLLAAGLAVVFYAGRLTADPVRAVETLDDTSRAVEKVASEIDDLNRTLEGIERNGISVRGSSSSASYPLTVRVRE